MIRSMTGFGSAEAVENGTSVKVEVHSVNGRFLDLKMKLPKSFSEYEGEIRKIAQDYIERGRVHVTVSLNVTGLRASSVRVDYQLAERYVKLAEELASLHGIENRMDARTLLSLPEILTWKEEDTSTESLWGLAKKAALAAFESHRAMRESEGAAIGRDFRNRLDNVHSHILEIEKSIPRIIETNTARFRKRIESLVGSDTFDEIRFNMEVALYADRVDITEECVRFKSHHDLFVKELAQKKSSGKKLSFLLQELNREVNTMGSKVMDAGIAGVVVSIKEDLEKMREQGENME
ncbi:MAG: YicC/YloC family endoribonuclease [Candidatus Latescibacter sp.]|nr:YicC/YloC family endoribonuclease [Candidatus Latescibacter sp.]